VSEQTTIIGVLRETMAGEQRITMTPDVAKRFQALGAQLTASAAG